MNLRGPVSLRNRISLVLVVVVAVAVAGANVAVFTLASRGLDQRVDEQLERISGFAERIADFASTTGLGPEEFPPDLVGFKAEAEYLGVVEPNGRVHDLFFGQSAVDRGPPAMPSGFDVEPGAAVVFDTTARIGGRRVPYRMRASAREDGWVVLAAVPTSGLAADRRQLASVQAVAALTVLLLLALLARWLVGVGLRPLARMERAAEQIADGDLTHRVEPAGPGTEISRLGTTLNRMLAEIEQAFAAKEATEQRLLASEQALRRFVADASHELRTPLTSIRGYAQLLRRDRIADAAERANAVSRIESEAARLAALVDDLLVLARLDEGAPPPVAPLDVSRLAGCVVDDARVVDPRRVISCEVPGPVELVGDGDGLTRVLTNLVANARQHTPPGSPIEIVVRDAGREVVVDVVDHGDGIGPEERSRLFGRFHRADPSRSRGRGGAGLGLAIVAGIVAAHGGRCDVRDTPGGGATFRVVLPRAAGPPQLAASV